MKLRWPNRYERARLILFVAWIGFTWLPIGDPMRKHSAMTAAIVCGVGFLLAGLLKPLHDDTDGEGA